MRKLIFLLLLAACSSPQPMKMGVTLSNVRVLTGTYAGLTLVNPTGVIDATGAVFIGPINITNSKGLTLIGGTSKNIDGDAIIWHGTQQRLIERGWSFSNIAGNCNNFPDKIDYTGDTSSLALWNATFDHCSLFKCGKLIQGAWGDASNKSLFMDSVICSNITVDSTLTSVEEVRGVIFRLNAFGWRVTYTGVNKTSGDAGVFYISGNSCIHDNIKIGGRGYWMRENHSSLGPAHNDYFYNNVDLNTSIYGTIDIRSEKGQFNQYARPGGQMYFYKNISGNKDEHANYAADMAMIGECDSGFDVHVNGNIGFLINSNGHPSKIVIDQSNGTWKGDSTGNFYYGN